MQEGNFNLELFISSSDMSRIWRLAIPYRLYYNRRANKGRGRNASLHLSLRKLRDWDRTSSKLSRQAVEALPGMLEKFTQESDFPGARGF